MERYRGVGRFLGATPTGSGAKGGWGVKVLPCQSLETAPNRFG